MMYNKKSENKILHSCSNFKEYPITFKQKTNDEGIANQENILKTNENVSSRNVLFTNSNMEVTQVLNTDTNKLFMNKDLQNYKLKSKFTNNPSFNIIPSKGSVLSLIPDFIQKDKKEPNDRLDFVTNKKILQNDKNNIYVKKAKVKEKEIDEKINLQHLLAQRYNGNYLDFIKKELQKEVDKDKITVLENKIKEINHDNYLKFEDSVQKFIEKEYESANFQENSQLKDEKDRKTNDIIKNNVTRLYVNSKNSGR